MQPRDPYLDTCILLSLLVPDSGSRTALDWLASQHNGPIWLSHWTWLEFTGVLAVCCRRGDISTERLRANGMGCACTPPIKPCSTEHSHSIAANWCC